MAALDFQPGERILVRAKLPWREGFVANAGRFMRYEHDRRWIVYEWCGLVATMRMELVTVERNDAPFRLY
jgi:hypothetical protein